jgi:hypothetical protein
MALHDCSVPLAGLGCRVFCSASLIPRHSRAVLSDPDAPPGDRGAGCARWPRSFCAVAKETESHPGALASRFHLPLGIVRDWQQSAHWRLHFFDTAFRMRGAFPCARASPISRWRRRLLPGPCRHVFSLKAVWHATDAVSSMTRSGHRTAAPRSSFRKGGAATFFPWASPIPRGDKKVAALPSCAALRP